MIPERNGISRLDEMMSGVVRWILDRVAYILYCIRISLYVVTDYRCVSAEISPGTDWFVYVAVFYSQLASRVTCTRSVQADVYLGRHVVLFEYFRAIICL